MAYSIYVVEDESIVSLDIQNSLKKLGYTIVGSSATGEKAIVEVEQKKPDLVLMDIMLKGEMTGIDAADHIKKTCQIPIVFLTAYADENTLNQAKVTEPYGYIIKPFKEIDLKTSIEMALYKHNKQMEIIKERDFLYSLVDGNDQDNSIFVKSKSKLVKVNYDDILFVEALKDYVIINLASVRYTIHSTMKDINTKLSGRQFLRVHRSYIINVDKILAIEQLNIIISGSKKIIPVGGSYKDSLFERIKYI